MKLKEQYYLPILLAAVTILLLTVTPFIDLEEWDEARHGINAYEMLHNGDYINLYYGGEPDTWNAKPPLMTWMIVACYKLIGFNELAVRLPTVIAVILFFFVFFKLVELLDCKRTAFFACLILLSCKAILGLHVGLNGDYDALLTLFLTTSVFFFIRATEFQKANALYLAAVFTGLAFYTKGTAAFIFLPGFLLYAIIQGKTIQLFRNYRSWISILIGITIVGSWLLLVATYGITTDHSVYGSKNSLETMLIHDTYRRMASNDFEVAQKFDPDRLFVFHVLDSRLNIWNYLFYLSVVSGFVLLKRHKTNLLTFVRQPANRLIVLSICMLLPLSLLLTFAQNKHDWYMAPVFGFFAAIIVKGVMHLGKYWKPLFYLAIAVFVFCFARHVVYLYTLPRDLHYSLSKHNSIFEPHRFIITTQTPQHFILYFNWLNLGFNRATDFNEIKQHKGKVLLFEAKDVEAAKLHNIKPIQYFDKYCMGLII